MAGYIGTQPVPQATQTRDSFTATAGQTSFATSGYAPGFLDVYLNGIKLAAADYTASNGSDVVLASGAALDDILEVVAYTAFEAANVTGADDFTVTGSFTSRGIDDNATSTAMTLDSSGKVGIGTSSPKGQGVHIVPSGGDTALVLSSSTGDTNSDEVNLVSLNKVNTGFQPLNLKAYTTRFHTNGSERMRLDASGNLLVGKTSANYGATAGFEFRGDNDTLYLANDGDKALALNRNTSDGEIISLRKNDATVGSIGTYNNDIYWGTDDTGLTSSNGMNAIMPFNPSTVAVRDSGIDLGINTVRFKDLYLSGGVYLGGTGSANKLDDYEEGTWTPTLIGVTGITYLNQIGSYTKVGNFVHCSFQLRATWTASGNSSIGGLPFTASSSGDNYGTGGFFTVQGAEAGVFPSLYVQPSQSTAPLYEVNNNTSWALPSGSSVYLNGNFFYRAS